MSVEAASPTIGKTKQAIVAALSHPEAEEGLYLRNLALVHEEDEREIVPGDEFQILDALKELMAEGQVTMDESGPEIIFFLSR